MEIFNENLGTISINDNTEIPKHKCHICDEFFDQNNLELHFLTFHTLEDEEPSQEYKSEICDKVFSKNYDLKAHIHEGEKNNKCDLCDKAFSQSGHLKRHINSVHKRMKNH